MRARKLSVGVLAFILWVATAGVGLWEIILVREMLFRLFARFSATPGRYQSAYWSSVAVGNWAVVVLSVVWVVAFIGGAEYHYRRVGQPSSWRLFARTIAIEAAILLLAWFV